MILNTQYIGKEPVVSGKLASEYAVGDSVFLTISGEPVEFLVVNQGIPSGSSLYDSSCDGTWLLMKDCYTSKALGNDSTYNYASSTIHTWLNNEFLKLFDANIQNAIKDVKIPYCVASYINPTVYSGTNGASCKVFPLSGYEVGFTTSTNREFPQDGAKILYFTAGTTTAANNLRCAYYNGIATGWWLRSPKTETPGSYWALNANGAYYASLASNALGIRPALIMPSEATFNPDTNEFISASGGGNT